MPKRATIEYASDVRDEHGHFWHTTERIVQSIRVVRAPVVGEPDCWLAQGMVRIDGLTLPVIKYFTAGDEDGTNWVVAGWYKNQHGEWIAYQ